MGYPLESIDSFAKELSETGAADVQRDYRACAAGRPTLSLVVGDETAARAAFKEAWP